MQALGAVYVNVARSDLPLPLVDLVYLRISQINGCACCISKRMRDVPKHGTPVEKLMLVSAWREAGDRFSERERAALRLPKRVTRIDRTSAPDDATAAAAARFSDKEPVDLAVAIGLMNTYNRIAIGMHRPPIPGTAEDEKAHDHA
jgi:AhpD family alkylhydroperoxidase